MKKWIYVICITLVFGFTLTACGERSPQKKVSESIGLDVSKGEVISDFDTHGGFHGDGTLCIVLQFSDDEILKQIEKSSGWQSFPMDSVTVTLAYGKKDETGSVGPYLLDSEGNTLIPEIQKGYYLLTDRSKGPGEEILERTSFNFTLAVYDVEEKNLYYCEEDT